MKTTLKAEIAVERWAVFAEMAWMESRPELGLICQKAGEQRDGRVTRETVGSLIPGLSDAAANNIIAWCKMLGLCDSNGAVTALGHDVAKSGEAPVPEQGVYDFWMIQHPVTEVRLLSVGRLASAPKDFSEDLRPLPFQPPVNKIFPSAIYPKERFLVRSYPNNSGPDPKGRKLTTKAECRLVWTLDFEKQTNEWRMEGRLEASGAQNNPPLPIQHKVESVALDLWELAAEWGRGPLAGHGQWDQTNKRLTVKFEGLKEEEIEAFRKRYELKEVEVFGRGTYRNVTVEEVPIGPKSPKDAQSWAMDRFERRLSKQTGYLSRSDVRGLFDKALEETPLEDRNLILPAHEELAGKGPGKDPARYWRLVAPVDLSLMPVSREELGALQLGSVSSELEPVTSASVFIRLEARRSMKSLVDDLLGGLVPQKLLLCDRYVIGDANLAVFKLFVQSVRAVNPSCKIEVWTEEDSKLSQFKVIQSITGSLPQNYQKVFGAGIPHDRYLLVLNDSGKHLAWHMTNSPLCARTMVSNSSPDSPLKWKDFRATQVSQDELPLATRGWFK